jgi:hypothetical protein
MNYYGIAGLFLSILFWSYKNEFHIDVNKNLVESKRSILWIPFSRFKGNIEKIEGVDIKRRLGYGESNAPYFQLTVRIKSGKEILTANRGNVDDLVYFIETIKQYLPKSIKYDLNYD